MRFFERAPSLLFIVNLPGDFAYSYIYVVSVEKDHKCIGALFGLVMGRRGEWVNG